MHVCPYPIKIWLFRLPGAIRIPAGTGSDRGLLQSRGAMGPFDLRSSVVAAAGSGRPGLQMGPGGPSRRTTPFCRCGPPGDGIAAPVWNRSSAGPASCGLCRCIGGRTTVGGDRHPGGQAGPPDCPVSHPLPPARLPGPAPAARRLPSCTAQTTSRSRSPHGNAIDGCTPLNTPGFPDPGLSVHGPPDPA